MAIYFLYATRIMPGLRVFKHILRGYSYMNVDRLRTSIQFFRRALELDPDSSLASQGMVALHNNLTLSKIDNDPGTGQRSRLLALPRPRGGLAHAADAAAVPAGSGRGRAVPRRSLNRRSRRTWLASITCA